MSDRLAELLHQEGSWHEHDVRKPWCERLAARLRAQGVTVAPDPLWGLSSITDDECLADDIAHFAARHHGVTVAPDATGLRKAAQRIKSASGPRDGHWPWCSLTDADHEGDCQAVAEGLILHAAPRPALASTPAAPNATGQRTGQNPRVVLGLDKADAERIAELALDPAYAALLRENDELRGRLAATPAAPPALDVERLARVLRRFDGTGMKAKAGEWAAAIAAAYAEDGHE